MIRRILVVDDELLCSFFLSSSLEEEGFSVKSAANGDEAIDVGRSFKPHVLITDWMLKEGRDGVEVAKELYALNNDLQIVFITGMASDAIQERVGEVPYTAILEKPIELTQVLEILNGMEREAHTDS